MKRLSIKSCSRLALGLHKLNHINCGLREWSRRVSDLRIKVKFSKAESSEGFRRGVVYLVKKSPDQSTPPGSVLCVPFIGSPQLFLRSAPGIAKKRGPTKRVRQLSQS
jgi:hypothetical protein